MRYVMFSLVSIALGVTLLSSHHSYASETLLLELSRKPGEVEISGEMDPVLVQAYEEAGSVEAFAVINSRYAAIVSGSWFRVLDLLKPGDPLSVASIELPGAPNVTEIEARDDLVFVAAGDAGLYVIDVTFVSLPTLVGWHEGEVNQIAVDDAHLFVSSSEPARIRVLDRLNISSLPEVASLNLHHTENVFIGDLALNGNILYVTRIGWSPPSYSIHGDFLTVDVSVPIVPTLINSELVATTPGEIAIVGQHAYVAERASAHLFIYDLANPVEPTYAGTFDTGHPAPVVYSGLSYSGLLYVWLRNNSGEAALYAINVTVPTNPHQVGSYDLSGIVTRDILASDNLVFMANRDAGLFIFCSAFSESHTYDSGFRPCPDGYRFSNSDSDWGDYPDSPANGDFTMVHMREMFGDLTVCVFPTFGSFCVPKLAAQAWLTFINYVMNGGHCAGMAATSLRFWNGDDSPANHQSDAMNPQDIALSNARRNIAYYNAEQFAFPIITHVMAASINDSPTDTLNGLQEALISNEPVVLAFRLNYSGGHAVVPIAVDHAGGGVWDVSVYDNNWPYQTRTISIDTADDTWTYDYDEWNITDSQQPIYLIPLELFNASQTCPCSASLLDSDTSMQVWLRAENAHLLIENEVGQRIGFVDGTLVNEIDGAGAHTILGGLGIEAEPVYMVPAEGNLAISISAENSDHDMPAEIVAFSPGLAASVSGIALSPLDEQTLSVSGDEEALVFMTESEQEVVLALSLDREDSSNRFVISNIDVNAGEAVSVTADLDNGQTILVNGISDGEYDFRLWKATTENQFFVHNNIVLTAGAVHYIDYSEWDGFGSLSLHVDYENDGMIDESFELVNQVARLYLPVSLSNAIYDDASHKLTVYAAKSDSH